MLRCLASFAAIACLAIAPPLAAASVIEMEIAAVEEQAVVAPAEVRVVKTGNRVFIPSTTVRRPMLIKAVELRVTGEQPSGPFEVGWRIT